MTNKTNGFIEWLDEIETAKNLTDFEISKKGKFSHSVLSRARSGFPPGLEVCVKIADVLKVSPITVLRKAGLLPEGNENIKFEDWQYLLTELDPQDEAELRQIAEMKIERKKKEKELKSLKTKRAG